MNKYVSGGVTFVIGGLVGSAITYFVLRDKFEARLDEQMEFMTSRMNEKIAALQKKMDEYTDAEVALEEATAQLNKRISDAETLFEDGQTFEMHKSTPEEIEAMDQIITDYRKRSMQKEKEESTKDDKGPDWASDPKNIAPYLRLISDSEYDNDEGFSKMYLVYYERDDVLAEGDTPMDVDEILDRSILKHFGDYEIDHVFVRDLEDEIDYDVCRVDELFWNGNR